MKKSKKKRIKKIILIIILITIILIIVFFIVNAFLREKVILKEKDLDELKKIFPENRLSDIKVYKKGLISIGVSKTFCKSIYINVKDSPNFLKDENYNNDILLLVHETTHTYQSKTIPLCIKTGISSIYNNLISYLRYGSRHYAYVYNLSEENYNPEQEASIIEDYFYLNFQNGDSSYIICGDCSNISDYELIKYLELKKSSILEKYR